VRGINLEKGDAVVAAAIVVKDATLLVAGENGIGKRTGFDEYRVQSRGGKGIITMKTGEKTGAVVGALSVAWMGRFRRMGRAVLLVQIALGVILAAFAVSRVLPLSYGLIFLGSIGLMMSFSLLMSLVQLAVPNDMRGRVVSVYMMAFRGGMPIGSLAAGYVAQVTSAPATLAATGILLSLVAAAFLARGRTVKEF